jgi:hypothetical protein
MRVTPNDISKLALKLVEVFSRSGPEDHNFGRYWRVVPPLQTFLESAVGPFEEEVAKSLLTAVERHLKRNARNSMHEDAEAAGLYLGATPRRPRRR